MIELEVNDIEFKLREYIPYTELGNLNLFGMVSIATRQQEIYEPYYKKNKKIEGETEKEYQGRIEKLMNKHDKQKLQELMFSYISVIQPLISSLLISPKLNEISIGTGIQLQNHPKMVNLIKSVIEDIKKSMEGKTGSKKA